MAPGAAGVAEEVAREGSRRGRARGAAGPAGGSAELAAAVLLDRGHVLRCVARRQGEAGLQGTRAVRARVGAGGVTEILGA